MIEFEMMSERRFMVAHTAPEPYQLHFADHGWSLKVA